MKCRLYVQPILKIHAAFLGLCVNISDLCHIRLSSVLSVQRKIFPFYIQFGGGFKVNGVLLPLSGLKSPLIDASIMVFSLHSLLLLAVSAGDLRSSDNFREYYFVLVLMLIYIFLYYIISFRVVLMCLFVYLKLHAVLVHPTTYLATLSEWCYDDQSLSVFYGFPATGVTFQQILEG